MSQWETIVKNVLNKNNISLDEVKQVGILYYTTTIVALEENRKEKLNTSIKKLQSS